MSASSRGLALAGGFLAAVTLVIAALLAVWMFGRRAPEPPIEVPKTQRTPTVGAGTAIAQSTTTAMAEPEVLKGCRNSAEACAPALVFVDRLDALLGPDAPGIPSEELTDDALAALGAVAGVGMDAFAWETDPAQAARRITTGHRWATRLAEDATTASALGTANMLRLGLHGRSRQWEERIRSDPAFRAALIAELRAHPVGVHGPRVVAHVFARAETEFLPMFEGTVGYSHATSVRMLRARGRAVLAEAERPFPERGASPPPRLWEDAGPLRLVDNPIGRAQIEAIGETELLHVVREDYGRALHTGLLAVLTGEHDGDDGLGGTFRVEGEHLVGSGDRAMFGRVPGKLRWPVSLGPEGTRSQNP